MTTITTGIAGRRPAALAGLALLATFATWTPVGAQLPDASISSLALAGNNTASVRAFGAISNNPAGLGMPGSGFSLTLVPVGVRLGLEPIGLSELVDYEGRRIPVSVREEWLQRIAAGDGERGSVGVDATAFALTLGSIGFQLSSTATASVSLPPDAAEALLYGNAGRTGEATDLSLVNAMTEGFAATTGAMSFALAVGPQLSFGMTGKYTVGHAVAVARAESGQITADPLEGEVVAPVVSSCFDEVNCTQSFANGGSGFGLDLGAMMDLGTITLGASLQNVVSNFSWDETKLAYRPGTLAFDLNDAESEFDELSFDSAPDDLKARIREYTFKPSYRLGAALDVSQMLTLTGDIQGQIGDDGITLGPKVHTGIGAELRLGFLHLRAGAAKITDGSRLGGGASLVLGPVNLSAAGGIERGDVGDAALGQFVLSFGHR